MAANLPSLDFGKFLSGNEIEKQQLADQLIASFTQHGFAKLVNHSISDDIVSGIWEWSRKLFSLSIEQKEKMAYPLTTDPQRGWARKGAEKTSRLEKQNSANKSQGKELLDEKEHFDCGPPDALEFPNLWPDPADLPGFKEFIEQYYSSGLATSLQVIRACELGLRVPPGTLLNMCNSNASEVRMLYYPEVDIATLKSGSVQRAWPHTDFGIITLLFQDSGGLELEDRKRPYTFVPVTTEKQNEMIVNISDTLQRWSNGSIPAGLHQVNIPPSFLKATKGTIPERYSSTFFLKPCLKASVGPLSPFVASENPAKYPEMTALELYNQRMGVLY